MPNPEGDADDEEAENWVVLVSCLIVCGGEEAGLHIICMITPVESSPSSRGSFSGPSRAADGTLEGVEGMVSPMSSMTASPAV